MGDRIFKVGFGDRVFCGWMGDRVFCGGEGAIVFCEGDDWAITLCYPSNNLTNILRRSTRRQHSPNQ